MKPWLVSGGFSSSLTGAGPGSCYISHWNCSNSQCFCSPSLLSPLSSPRLCLIRYISHYRGEYLFINSLSWITKYILVWWALLWGSHPFHCKCIIYLSKHALNDSCCIIKLHQPGRLLWISRISILSDNNCPLPTTTLPCYIIISPPDAHSSLGNHVVSNIITVFIRRSKNSNKPNKALG